MKLSRHPAPHIRHQENNRTLMSDVLILLMVLMVLAYLFYGLRALVVCGVSVLTAVLTDAVCTLLRGRRLNLFDLSPVVTGMLIALCMPATISFKIVASAAFFAIAIAKHPFGGLGNNLFNPAASGISFAAICWPRLVFIYPMPFSRIGVLGTVAANATDYYYTYSSVNAQGIAQEISLRLYQNPAFVLKVGGVPTNDLTEMLLGNYPGPMGATNILVLMTCLVYLLFRRTVRWQMPIPFLGTCALIALLFPRTGQSRLRSVEFEMMSGLLLFGAVFMISDPVTSPKRDSAYFVYGIFAGSITMGFRYFGGFEESMPFAVLLANAFVPLIDRYNERLHRLIRRKQLESRKNQNLQEA